MYEPTLPPMYEYFRQTLGLHLSILFLTPKMLQTSDFERSDLYYHYKSDIYIKIPRKCRPEDQQGLLLASAVFITPCMVGKQCTRLDQTDRSCFELFDSFSCLTPPRKKNNYWENSSTFKTNTNSILEQI